MPPPTPRTPGVAALALTVFAALVAGCVGAEAPTEAGPSQADGSVNGSPAPVPARSPALLATSHPEIPVLGLATYDAVPRDRVAPHVPGNYTPIPCFRPGGTGTVDVYLVVTEEHHPDLLPSQEATVRSLSLIACADRPDPTRRDDANEPPWVLLRSWSEGEAVEGFLSQRGFSARPADLAIETTPDGYRFQATTPNGTVVAEGRFTTPGVGAPTVFTCEPRSFRGRVVQEGSEGLVSLGWNKTEAACPAEAAVTWPAEGAVADVLGPARAPSYAIDSQVEEARYWYRRLGTG